MRQMIYESERHRSFANCRKPGLFTAGDVRCRAAGTGRLDTLAYSRKQFTIRILLDQFPQQLSREGGLIFTARRKGEDDFGERAQIATVRRSPPFATRDLGWVGHN